MQTLLNAGFVPVDLKAGNVKVGDDIATWNMLFARLQKITKKGNYKVRFDMDFADDPLTKFKPVDFERIFLVKKSKKD